jgi:hypothetical protein
LLSAFIVINPLERYRIRPITPLYTKIREPIPKNMVAYTNFLGNLLYTQPFTIVKINKQFLDRLTKSLFYFGLAFSPNKNTLAIPRTCGSFLRMAHMNLVGSATNFANLCDWFVSHLYPDKRSVPAGNRLLSRQRGPTGTHINEKPMNRNA